MSTHLRALGYCIVILLYESIYYIHKFSFFLPLHAYSYTLHGLNTCVTGTKGLERDSRNFTGSEEKQIEKNAPNYFSFQF